MHAQGHLLPAAHQLQRLQQLFLPAGEVQLLHHRAEAGGEERRAGIRQAAHRRLVGTERLRGQLGRLLHLAGKGEQPARADGEHRLAQRTMQGACGGRIGQPVDVEGAHFFLTAGAKRSAAQSKAVRRR